MYKNIVKKDGEVVTIFVRSPVINITNIVTYHYLIPSVTYQKNDK